MFWFMILVVCIFVVIVVYISRAVVSQLEQRAEEDILRAKNSYQQIIDQKEKAAQEKRALEAETNRIFQLYELTRDVTKTFDRDEAFQVFKRYMMKMIQIEDCLLLETHDSRVEQLKAVPNSYVHVLQGRKNVYGYLVVKGVHDQDINTIDILAHQFVLALRRIHLYEQIEEIATTDSLTDLDTRRYFMERFEEELQRAKAYSLPLVFLILDADHFKKINDQHGHLTGDQVLREIAAMVRENIREIDFAGRFGGEEFCVVLPDTQPEAAMVVAERIRKAVESKPIQAYDSIIQVTVSIGVSSFPTDGDVTDSLIDKADWALYRAKKQGRNAVCAFGQYNADQYS